MDPLGYGAELYNRGREACLLPPLRGGRCTGCDAVAGGPALPDLGPTAMKKHEN